jgi:hypothetical protein
MFDQLAENPIEIGSKYAIIANCGTVQQTISNGKWQKWGHKDVPLVTVHPVAALKISSARKVDGNLEVNLDDSGEGPAAYYLPWGMHAGVRMRLTVDPPPKFFFTASLNGCAAIVEGPTLIPTVYHMNAASHMEEYSPLGDPKCVEPVALQLLHERNEIMFGAHEAYPDDGSRLYVEGGFGKAAGAVTPLEYGVLIGRESERAEIDALVKNQHSKKYVAPLFVRSYGCVFGVWNSETQWRFFVQKIVETKDGQNIVLRCAEFWPKGFNRPMSVP